MRGVGVGRGVAVGVGAMGSGNTKGVGMGVGRGVGIGVGRSVGTGRGVATGAGAGRENERFVGLGANDRGVRGALARGFGLARGFALGGAFGFGDDLRTAGAMMVSSIARTLVAAIHPQNNTAIQKIARLFRPEKMRLRFMNTLIVLCHSNRLTTGARRWPSQFPPARGAARV